MRGAASLLSAILVLLLASLTQAQVTQTPTAALTLVSREGRRVIPTTLANGREFVALDDMTSVFQVSFREDALAGGLTVAYRGRTIAVSSSLPLASVNGRAVALSAPATRIGNRWSVPIDFFPSALSLIYEVPIELRRAARLLVVGDVAEIEVTTRSQTEVAPQGATTTDTASPAAPPAAPPVAPPEAILAPPESRTVLGTIVIDPGHGGNDAGVRGRGGSEEKALTLTIAQRIKALIESRLGIRVILTRDGDRGVSLDERAAIANNNKAGLFVSLHLNASPVASNAGAEVVHSRGGRESEDRPASEGEPVVLPVFGGATRTVDLIRWDLAHSRHMEASAAFAEILEEQLRSRVAMSPRPRREMPLRVLSSVNMPAVLVEMAYLSNVAQERLARSEAYQAGISQAIFDAVLQFRSYLEGREAP